MRKQDIITLATIFRKAFRIGSFRFRLVCCVAVCSIRACYRQKCAPIVETGRNCVFSIFPYASVKKETRRFVIMMK